MKKILLTLIILFSFINVSALEISSENYALYNLNNNEIVLEKNKDEFTQIASLTKIMTTIVAIENIENFDETITMTSEMFRGLYEQNAYQIGLRVGEKVTYNDLLYGTLIASGADATRGLTISIAGSEEAYVELMNKKAKELKLENTVFKNPVGLDEEGQGSTLDDVATMLSYALKNEKFRTIFETQSYTLTNGRISFGSSMLGYARNYGYEVSYIKGSKTGYTLDAGRCLASIAYDKENDINYMLITTKASTDKKQAYHVLDAVNIYNYYFENYKYHTILEKGKLLTTIKVKDSKLEEIKIENKNEIKKYLKNDYNTDDIKIEYEGKEEVNFKDKKGDKLGVVKLYYQDKEVNSIDIYLEEEIKFNLFSHILQSKIRISLLGVIFVGIVLLIIKKGAKF